MKAAPPSALCMQRLSSAALVAMLAFVACDRADAPDTDAPIPPATTSEQSAVAFDTGTLTFLTAGGPVQMPVEIAERADQRAYGLMDRDQLDQDAGMLFLYDQLQQRDTGFWMYRTRIPLDIAFFDGAGQIVAIHQMMPCASLDAARCPGYSAGVPYFGAIEANRGYFTRNSIRVGDRIVLPGRIGG